MPDNRTGTRPPMQRRWVAVTIPVVIIVVSILLFAARVLPIAASPDDQTPPTLDIWYGTRQDFGFAGLSQRWVNVLGNASDPQSGIASLSYRLNGGPVTALRMGPDDRRLLKPGDFNVEIDPALLHQGDNRLEISATNRAGLKSAAGVTVVYQRSPTPLPLPFAIDWSKVKNAQDALQIVDGKWQWNARGIHPLELGYDRMLNVGDSRWSNYQVTVPIKVNGIDPAGFHDTYSGEQASFAVDMYWIGHSDDPVHCDPPHCGWNPVGDFNKFFFRQNGKNYLGLKIQEKEKDFPTLPYTLDIGDTYIFKTSVQSTPQGNLFRMKVWEEGKEKEPKDWMFQRLAPYDGSPGGSPRHGAFALVAHYADVTIGNIQVTSLP